jgi:integrase
MAKGLYKRGKFWWLRYAGPDGRIRYESSGSASKKKAQDVLIQRKNEVREGKDPSALKRIPNVSFRELSEQYLSWAERQRSYRSKKGFIKQLLNVFGNIPLRKFTTMLVEEYQSAQLNDGKSHSTANRHLATLKHMFTKAVEWELAEEVVLKKVRRVKQLPENNRRLRYLSMEECSEFISACSSHLRPIVITALNTGMRKEEILSLKWDENIDLKHRFILLTNTKNGERREIPLNQVLFETLQSVPRHINSPYVFVDDEGRRFTDVKRSFKTACRKIGIKDFRFHDFRHTFASHLVMAGVDITTVKELLGHKTLTMTLRYAHLSPSHKADAVSILDGMLNYDSSIQKVYNQPKSNKKGSGKIT